MSTSDLYSDWADRHGDSVYESAIEAKTEEIVLNVLESIDTLTDDERENVRHEVWLVLDEAVEYAQVYIDTGDDTYVTVDNSVYDDIDAAVARGLSYTRTAA